MSIFNGIFQYITIRFLLITMKSLMNHHEIPMFGPSPQGPAMGPNERRPVTGLSGLLGVEHGWWTTIFMGLNMMESLNTMESSEKWWRCWFQHETWRFQMVETVVLVSLSGPNEANFHTKRGKCLHREKKERQWIGDQHLITATSLSTGHRVNRAVLLNLRSSCWKPGFCVSLPNAIDAIRIGDGLYNPSKGWFWASDSSPIIIQSSSQHFAIIL